MNKRVDVRREYASPLVARGVDEGGGQVCVEDTDPRVLGGCEVVHARTMMHLGAGGAA